MEGSKLVVDFPNYRHTSEVVGDKLVEVSIRPLGLGTDSSDPLLPAVTPPRGQPLGSRIILSFDSHTPCQRGVLISVPQGS